MKTRNLVALSALAGAMLGAGAIQGLHAQAKPPAYFIAENDVTNADGYAKEYLPLAKETIKAHGGKYLAAGSATPVSGQAPKGRVVILIWDSTEQLMGWFNSPEYQKARKIGEQYATYNNFWVPGVAQ